MARRKTQTDDAPDSGGECRVRFTPDGVEVQCETPEATRRFVDAALTGKVTITFAPKAKANRPDSKGASGLGPGD